MFSAPLLRTKKVLPPAVTAVASIPPPLGVCLRPPSPMTPQANDNLKWFPAAVPSATKTEFYSTWTADFDALSETTTSSSMASNHFTTTANREDENDLVDDIEYSIPVMEAEDEITPVSGVRARPEIPPSRLSEPSRSRSGTPFTDVHQGQRHSSGRRSSGGSTGGRKQSYAKVHCFEEIVEDGEVVGSVCKGCGKQIRDKQRRSQA